jgi:hypothetical protein
LLELEIEHLSGDDLDRGPLELLDQCQ